MIHCVRLETQRSAQVESRDDMSRFHFLFCYFLCSVHCLVYKNALQSLCHQSFFYQTDLTRFLSLEFFTTRFDKISLVTLFHFDTVFPYFSKGIRKTFFFVFSWRLSYFCRKLDQTFVLFFQHSLVKLNRKRQLLQLNFKLNFCFMVTIMGPCQTNKIFFNFLFSKNNFVFFPCMYWPLYRIYEPFSGFIVENC